MQIILMCLLLLLVLVYIIRILIAKKTKSQGLSPVSAALPLQKQLNDKIVVIKGAGAFSVKEAIQQFCADYNKDTYVIIAHLVELPNGTAITFPYDITFDMLCFMVNYMQYPKGISYHADIKAWTTTKPADEWIGKAAANKKVMLYIPADDKEYDNVYASTPGGIGYKLSFASGLHIQEQPLQSYTDPPVNYEQLKAKPGEEIR